MGDWRLLVETSGRTGQLGLARGDQLLAERSLDATRRHNRDLAPTVAELLQAFECRPTDLNAIVVSLGPGSFTGLRVGLMSAMALAWAVDAAIIPVPTFEAIIETLPSAFTQVDVVADALQGMLYVQGFARASDEPWHAVDALRIVEGKSWQAERPTDRPIYGPGAELVNGVAPHPTLRGLFQASFRHPELRGTAFLSLEPLYLRGSSAEEKAAARNTERLQS
jgi:tRNA threonylcarbamoyladenosine biosynthesis protein TsaB